MQYTHGMDITVPPSFQAACQNVGNIAFTVKGVNVTVLIS